MQSGTILFHKQNFNGDFLVLYAENNAAIFTDINQAVKMIISMAELYHVSGTRVVMTMMEPDYFCFQAGFAYARKKAKKNTEESEPTDPNDDLLYTILSVYNMGDKACIYSERQLEQGKRCKFLTASDVQRFYEKFCEDEKNNYI